MKRRNKRNLNRALALLTSGAMLAGDLLPVLAAEPTEGAVKEASEGNGEEGYFPFVPGYIPEDDDVPAVVSGLSYAQMREEQVSTDEERLFTAPSSDATESAYPMSYTEDWLTYMKTTYPTTRNQGSYGTCWAHSAMFLGEAYLIKHGKADTSIDLSELHHAYWSYTTGTGSAAAGYTGDKAVYTKSEDAETILDNGGNLSYSAQSLMRQRGYAKESVAPYSDAAKVAAGNGLDASTERNDSFYLTNAYELNIQENPGLVKSAIKENGAVGVSIYAQSYKNPPTGPDFYNDSNNAYWCPQAYSTNHAVAIVGWDDDFPADRFAEQGGLLPEGDGAWLIRNSWSTTTKEDYFSYFWLSYYDASLLKKPVAWAYEADNKFPYDNHYYYDSQIHKTGYISNSTIPLHYANIYTVNGAAGAEKEVLEAVDFEVHSVPGEGVGYTVEVYTDLTGDTPATGTKVSAATTTGQLYFNGDYTVKLAEPVSLTKGSRFAIVLYFDKAGMGVAREVSTQFGAVAITAASAGNSCYLSGSTWKNSDYDFVLGALTTDGEGGESVTHVTGVSLNTDSLQMRPEDTATLVATVEPEDADDPSVSWSSDEPTVAIVDANGKVTAVAEGTATITATTTDGGYTADCEVTVTDADDLKISFGISSITLCMGTKGYLEATVMPEPENPPTFIWSSGDESIVTVKESGDGVELTPVALGTTVVTVKTSDGKSSASIPVTVKGIDVIGVTLDKETLELKEGESETLTASIKPTGATNKNVIWSSSDEDVATVSASGKVTAVSAGTATITVVTEDGDFDATCEVTVTEAEPSPSPTEPEPVTVDVTGVTLSEDTLELKEGESATLTATVEPEDATNPKVSWSSDDPDVATVSDSGKVTAVSAGTATITVLTEDGNFEAICEVTVTEAEPSPSPSPTEPEPVTVDVTGVTLSEDTLELKEGESTTLTATVEPEDATNPKVSWSSDDPDVATVSDSGKVTAVSAGTATITVLTEDGNFEAICEVTVTEAEPSPSPTGPEDDPEPTEPEDDPEPTEPEDDPEPTEPEDDPEPTEPEDPTPTEPEDPTPTEPEAPTPTEPEAPTPTEPEDPTPTEPEDPTPTEPEAPTPTEPEAPTPTEPEDPTPTEPEDPTPTEPEDPTPTEPEDPTPTEPEDPTPTEPEDPTPTEPEDPTPTEPEDPTPTEPEDDPSPTPVSMEDAAAQIEEKGVDAVVESIKDSDSASIAEAMSDPKQVAALALIEDSYKEAHNITEKTPESKVEGIDASRIEMTGAALNIDSGSVGLVITEPQNTEKIDRDGYGKLFLFDMTVDAVKEDGSKADYSEELDIPVTITMPVPEVVSLDSLSLVHFDKDGHGTELKMLLDTEKRSITFTVTHFSLFAFANVAEEQDKPEEPKEPVSGNTFSVEAAAKEGIPVIQKGYTLKLETDPQTGAFKSATICDAEGKPADVDSYLANMVTEYEADGKTPKTFYTLVFTDGKWDTSYDSGEKGAYEYKGVEYFVAGGVVNQNANGLIYTGAAGWRFLAAGHVVTDNEGLVMYADKWFWIDAQGKCDDTYAAIVMWNGANFLVHGGRLRTDYTGFTYDPQNTAKWYHITAGQVWGDGEITDMSIEGGEITRTVVNGVVQ